MNESDLLREQWESVARSLSIRFTAPFVLPLPDGNEWVFSIHLPQFGGGKGMLIGVEYSELAFAEAKKLGYCVSSMLAEYHYLPIDPQDYIECLMEWSWESEEEKPKWYTNAT